MAKIKNSSLNDLINETKKHLKGEPNKSLNESNFKIIKGKSFDYYVQKYGSKSTLGVKAYKKADLGYMKKGKKYYQLKEGAYISIPNFFTPAMGWIPTHKAITGAIAAAVAASGTVGGLAVGGVFDGNANEKEESREMMDPLKFTATQDNSSVGYDTEHASELSIHIQYSEDDGVSWKDWTNGADINLDNGESIRVRNTNDTLSINFYYDYFQFTMTGEIEASGNVNSMINGHSLSEYCYSHMFDYCKVLTSAPTLPSTTLAKGCYRNMFGNCEALTSAPELPATKLEEECYYEMFVNCSSVTIAPDLPAITLADHCYEGMFLYCSKLNTMPELPAKTLKNSCYKCMFQDCNFTTTSTIAAETLAPNCYEQMFMSCDYLTNPPELPATELFDSCYKGMFSDCEALAFSPKLPATTLVDNCYANMFYRCNKFYVREETTTPGETDEHKIFACPHIDAEITNPVTNMFFANDGLDGSTPTEGHTYYWYIPE